MTSESTNLSLLMTKLKDELAEYEVLEHYCSRKNVPRNDKRYWLYVRLIGMTESGSMVLNKSMLPALLEIDGVLSYCWDIYFARHIPKKYLFRELVRYYEEGEVW